MCLVVHVFGFWESIKESLLDHAIFLPNFFSFFLVLSQKLNVNFRVLFQSYHMNGCFLQIYRKIGEKYGVEYSETEILNRYRRAYSQPWGKSRLR